MCKEDTLDCFDGAIYIHIKFVAVVVVVGNVCIMERLEKSHSSTASQTITRCSSAQVIQT